MLCETDISSLFVAVGQSLSFVQLFATPWTVAHQASLFFTISWSLLKVTSIESMIIQPSCPLSPLLLLPSIFPSIRVFSNELALCIRWPKYWSFSFSISLSNKYSGSPSSRIDWFDFLAVQGTLKSLLQHQSYTTLSHSFPSFEQVSFPCKVLTVASWPAYRFLRRQVRWSVISISLRIFHSLLWSTQLEAFL